MGWNNGVTTSFGKIDLSTGISRFFFQRKNEFFFTGIMEQRKFSSRNNRIMNTRLFLFTPRVLRPFLRIITSIKLSVLANKVRATSPSAHQNIQTRTLRKLRLQIMHSVNNHLYRTRKRHYGDIRMKPTHVISPDFFA